MRRALLVAALGALAACHSEPTSPPTFAADSSPRQLITLPPPPAQTVVVRWSGACLQAIRTSKLGPPMVARALGMVHTAIYDAWAAYDAKAVGTRLGGTLRRPAKERTDANMQRAVSYAAYRTLADLFPTKVAEFNALMAEYGYDPNDQSLDVTTPTGIGNRAAQALLQFRHTDGSNQLGDLHPGAYSDYTGYVPVNTPDQINDSTRWQPLRVQVAPGQFVVQTFTAPQWGRVISFAMTSPDEFRPRILQRFYPFDSIRTEVDRILAYSRGLDDRQKVIAEYWADGPNSELPPGHWCLMAAWVSNRDHHTIGDDAKMFFALGNAVMDAGIAAWDSKRFFDSIRPISAVHYYKAGQMVQAWGGPGKGVVWMRAEDWQPYQPSNVVTPPFPEYFSGHSSFSGAAAEVLRRYTGSDGFGASVTIPAFSSRVEPGLVPATDVTLSWSTFSQAADEAGMSRRYGGIHFVPGDLLGRAIGRMVGAQVYTKAQRYWTGRL
jgi:hypothetical protein